jgi:thiol-disulfide isomerase/thioredoxin
MTCAPLLFALLIATPNTDAPRDPLLLDFTASWCGPCQQMRPNVEQLARKGYPVKVIDFDRSRDVAERYQVSSIPTFIVVDSSGRPLARTEGYQPAADLERFYLAARTKARRLARAARDADDQEADADPGAVVDRAADDAETRPAQEPEPEPADEPRRDGRTNPDPWKTVVRIKIRGNGSIGFGSGTIIYSDPEQSIILTCAHIFKLEGSKQAHPSRFPRPIDVDLFDGTLSAQNQVHYVETIQGKAIDYDFDRDVGLILIRPGRRLEASRVVPANWVPKPGMKMTTVGCSEGNDATAWTTAVINSGIRLFNNSVYEATECQFAPKQGRSGGGLYTIDGYLAGVCDFAEPRGNHGFYATPRSIRAILDRNNLAALYAPVNRQGGALLAKARTNPGRSIARAQSPDGDEPTRVTMPSPELLGIKTPASTRSAPQTASTRGSWRPVPDRTEPAERTDLKLPPGVDNNRFDPLPEKSPDDAPAIARAPRVQAHAKGKWRPVKSASPMISAAPGH